MDISEIIKIFETNKTQNNTTEKIPEEIINQYPYGQFPIKYTKEGQEKIRKQCEDRFNKDIEENINQNQTSDINSILPLISLLTNKKQPKDIFELLSCLITKDKPELKNLFKLLQKPNPKEPERSFPDTNKVSINSFKRIN